jgi:ABC-type glycerol-3-phosphate transport system substrate-binding protein
LGCGKKEGGPEKIELRYMTLSSPEEMKIIEKQIAEFEKKEPGIHVNIINMPFMGYQEKLSIMASSNTLPDVFNFFTRWMYDLHQGEMLLPLDDFFKKSQLSLDDFSAAPMHLFLFDGDQFGQGSCYGIPRDWTPGTMIFYNKKLFKEAGVEPPKESWSWDEFAQACRKLTKKDSAGRHTQYGAYLPLSWICRTLVLENGGAYFSADGTRCTLDSPEALEAIKFAYRLIKEEEIVVPEHNLKEGCGPLTESFFLSQKVAMVWTFYLRVHVFEEQAEFPWGVMALTHNKKRLNIVPWPFGLGIGSSTKHPEAAWKLLQHMIGYESQLTWAKMGWNFPTLNSLLESGEYVKPEHRAYFDAFLKQTPYLSPPYMSPHVSYSWCKDQSETALEKGFLGLVPLEKAVKESVKVINAKIKENIEVN